MTNYLAGLGQKLMIFSRLIKFEHTLFALPFAYLGLFLSSQGRPGLKIFFWVTMAMAGLRTAAMAWNRVLDLKWDRRNTRTQDWPLCQSQISVPFVVVVACIASGLYFLSASFLNPLTMKLSPLPFVAIILYPYTKRFTWACHFVLGAVLGMAPAAGWIAWSGAISTECWILWFSVTTWVAGFDLIYSMQDEAFDKAEGLHSFPARFGPSATLMLSRILHLLTWISFVMLGKYLHLGLIYWLGVAVVFICLILEQYLVRQGKLKNIQTAFFYINVVVSMTMLLVVCLHSWFMV